jgi:ATP-dependent exoDNAse (exonuclease V) alpha subunit
LPLLQGDRELFNGDIGCVVKIDEEEGLVYIEYDSWRVEYETGELDEVSLIYAMTVHKLSRSITCVESIILRVESRIL